MKPGLEWNHPKPRIWTPREIEIFASHADEMGRWSVGTAVILNEWIGQREGDVLGMLRSAYQDGALRFEQSKTKRSEEHTSELQSLMRISYAVFCLKKKTKKIKIDIN